LSLLSKARDDHGGDEQRKADIVCGLYVMIDYVMSYTMSSKFEFVDLNMNHVCELTTVLFELMSSPIDRIHSKKNRKSWS
jgi:hypothetical protein